ncbi:hypothetical protein D1872_232600 [compost metagenome]
MDDRTIPLLKDVCARVKALYIIARIPRTKVNRAYPAKVSQFARVVCFSTYAVCVAGGAK